MINNLMNDMPNAMEKRYCSKSNVLLFISHL